MKRGKRLWLNIKRGIVLSKKKKKKKLEEKTIEVLKMLKCSEAIDR